MSTVVKALSLLDHFDASIPEVGLVDMARLSGLDKATARRLLVALGKKGFVEQDPVTRRYRLGAALVRLARIREIALPMLDIARPLVEELSRQCGETVHVSQVAANLLSSVLVCESPHANRVSVAVGQNLPFHCDGLGHRLPVGDNRKLPRGCAQGAAAAHDGEDRNDARATEEADRDCARTRLRLQRSRPGRRRRQRCRADPRSRWRRSRRDLDRNACGARR